MNRRWDGDARGTGIADGRAFLRGLDALAQTMRRPGWVAEDPDAHLLPHIERAAEESGRFRLLEEHLDDGVYRVVLEWTPTEARKPALREDVFALIGSFVEFSTHVRQRVVDGAVEFDVTTGMLADETHFETHGHLVRLRIEGDAARAVAG